jgi:alkaline phosphatase
LVVVTSDHETGGLGITGGSDGAAMLVRWATSGHTAEPVPVFAFGPGAEQIAGVHDNTDVAHLIADVLGLDLAAAALR